MMYTLSLHDALPISGVGRVTMVKDVPGGGVDREPDVLVPGEPEELLPLSLHEDEQRVGAGPLCVRHEQDAAVGQTAGVVEITLLVLHERYELLQVAALRRYPEESAVTVPQDDPSVRAPRGAAAAPQLHADVGDHRALAPARRRFPQLPACGVADEGAVGRPEDQAGFEGCRNEDRLGARQRAHKKPAGLDVGDRPAVRR